MNVCIISVRCYSFHKINMLLRIFSASLRVEIFCAGVHKLSLPVQHTTEFWPHSGYLANAESA